jgi:hypothetical protein
MPTGLRGQLEGVTADWTLIGPEDTALLDVRMTLRADDGAAICKRDVQVQRRGHLAYVVIPQAAQ